ncbi:hypothetical protein EU546_01460 [Candidatus Thorarchaeota archaeon]|nr:MAG: hypothetical protein EU546_01460 [Candidatus Thorarchaeota archaeon]
MYMLDPSQIEADAKQEGLSREDLVVPEAVVLTFSGVVRSDFAESYGMKIWRWPGWKFSPYSTPSQAFKGSASGVNTAVVIPPMGASPLIAMCEELSHFGAQTILLLCASWSLGPDRLAKGEIQLPTFAVGLDGTSPHYGNSGFRVKSQKRVDQALSSALDESRAEWKTGGVGSCEAIYRISQEMVDDYVKMGCLSMENGETAALFSLAKVKDLNVGILLQPYLDLTQGWAISYMDDAYKTACHSQAEAAMLALKTLHS